MPVSIRIALAQQQSFDLFCGNQSRRVDRKEIESLAAVADGDHILPQLIALGQRLDKWLDGNEGWLRTGLTGGESVVLLDLAAPLQAQDRCERKSRHACQYGLGCRPIRRPRASR